MGLFGGGNSRTDVSQTDSSVNTDNSGSTQTGGDFSYDASQTDNTGAIFTGGDLTINQTDGGLAQAATDQAWLADWTAVQLGTKAYDSANYQAGLGSKLAETLGYGSQKTARELGQGAFNLASEGLGTALTLGKGSYDLARDLGGGAFDLAYNTNEQNTGFLGRIGAQLMSLLGKTSNDSTWLAGHSIDAGNALAQFSINKGNALAESALGFGGDVLTAAIASNSDATTKLADNYQFNADRSAAMYENSLAGIESLAKSTTTGGQTEVNKSFVWIIGIAGAVLALAFLSRK